MRPGKLIYDHLPPTIQARIDCLRYATGLLPRVDPVTFTNQAAWLPVDKRAAVVISADLELGWAWRYERTASDPQALALRMAEQTRCNLPRLLELFDDYEVPITWATVGHLFLDSCTCQNGRAHPDLPRPAYFENEFWRYSSGDWYDCDPCHDFHISPAWYGPDIIEAILSARVKHEIACHTFSHIDCSEAYCPSELMEAELRACQEAARPWGLELRSLAFPANYPGNLPVVQKLGFKSYRQHGRYHLGFPEQDEYGLWRIPGGIQLETPPGWQSATWAKVLCRCIDRAVETGTLLSLWFHPSCEESNLDEVFPKLLKHINSRSLWITTFDKLGIPHALD
jgi:peptidoglycan/xylan/chitin deacetylase (PgdA/CDA1 family)